MHRYIRTSVVSSLVLVTLAAGASAAEPGSGALNTPSISAGVTGHAKQTLIVEAGASGLPHGFTVRWMDESTFNAYGRQWPSFSVPGEGRASFTGLPTLNTFNGQYTTFEIAPNQSIAVEIGDLLQESGVSGSTGELEYGQRYYFAAVANDEVGNPGSSVSNTVNATTTEPTDCTFTVGYWKNHKSAWPVLSLTLGTVLYNQQQLCDILDQSVKGNGLVSLAHQLIAAKLNIANGADGSDAFAAIAAADGMIGNLVVPPIGNGYLPPSQTASTTQTLDDYNNGVIGPGHCGPVAAQTASWGVVKALYR